MGGILSAFVVIAISGILMLAIYAGGLWVFRVPEARDVARPLLRRIGRG